MVRYGGACAAAGCGALVAAGSGPRRCATAQRGSGPGWPPTPAPPPDDLRQRQHTPLLCSTLTVHVPRIFQSNWPQPVGFPRRGAPLKLSDAGVPIQQIARLVGHTGTTTTETVYRKQIRPGIRLSSDLCRGRDCGWWPFGMDLVVAGRADHEGLAPLCCHEPGPCWLAVCRGMRGRRAWRRGAPAPGRCAGTVRTCSAGAG